MLSGDETIKGKVEIDADGIVTLDMPKSKTADWVEEQLNSMVQHRMPDGEVSQGDVTFAEENGPHPLGRKIDLGDPSLQSAYPHQGRRDHGSESLGRPRPCGSRSACWRSERNAEGKYLPRSFTMNFFDSKTGDLRMSLGYLNSWQRVGEFDVPDKIIEVDAHKGGASTKEIAFTNCELLSK